MYVDRAMGNHLSTVSLFRGVTSSVVKQIGEVAGVDSSALPIVLGDGDDPESLRALAEQTRVVCTTVGPWILPVIVDVIDDDEIQISVLVEIPKSTRGGPLGVVQAESMGPLLERAVSSVAPEPIAAVIENVEIRPTVIVDVADGASSTPSIIGDA